MKDFKRDFKYLHERYHVYMLGYKLLIRPVKIKIIGFSYQIQTPSKSVPEDGHTPPPQFFLMCAPGYNSFQIQHVYLSTIFKCTLFHVQQYKDTSHTKCVKKHAILIPLVTWYWASDKWDHMFDPTNRNTRGKGWDVKAEEYESLPHKDYDIWCLSAD